MLVLALMPALSEHLTRALLGDRTPRTCVAMEGAALDSLASLRVQTDAGEITVQECCERREPAAPVVATRRDAGTNVAVRRYEAGHALGSGARTEPVAADTRLDTWLAQHGLQQLMAGLEDAGHADLGMLQALDRDGVESLLEQLDLKLGTQWLLRAAIGVADAAQVMTDCRALSNAGIARVLLAERSGAHLYVVTEHCDGIPIHVAAGKFSAVLQPLCARRAALLETLRTRLEAVRAGDGPDADAARGALSALKKLDDSNMGAEAAAAFRAARLARCACRSGLSRNSG